MKGEGVLPVKVIVDRSSKFANPGPLGLAAFGVSTFLLNCHNAGFWQEFDSMLLGVGIAFGGITQIIVGVMQFLSNSTVGALLFFSYGCFWITLCFGIILHDILAVPRTSELSLFMFLLMWGIFTLFALFAELQARKVALIQIVFGMLDLLFFLLAAKHLCSHYGFIDIASVIGFVAGWEGIFLGLFALYLGMGQLVNGELDYVIFPIIFPLNLFSTNE